MSDFIKALKDIAKVRTEADKTCSDMFCEAMGEPDILKKDWPPHEKTKLISNEDMQKYSYHAKETDMPWIILTPVPDDKMTYEEQTCMSYIDLDYAMEHGALTHRVMSPRIAGDINKMGEVSTQAVTLIQGAIDSLKEEISKYENAELLSDIAVYSHMEGYLMSVFMACIVVQKPSQEVLEQIKMKELNGRMMDLLKAMPSLIEGEPPNPKSWEWTFTKHDAALVVKMLTTSNPGTEAIQAPDDLMQLTVMGVTVSKVDAKETGIQLKLHMTGK